MGEKTKNLLIGLFILGGMLLVVFIILFLKPHVGNGEEILYIRFSNINKIGIGTRVTFAGRPVGEVIRIDEIHDARAQPSDQLGRLYFYQLVLRVDSSVKVYDTDEISLQTSGLLGEKSVAIVPKKAPKGVVPKLISNQPIYADSVDPIENTFHELSQLAGEIHSTVVDLHSWIDENRDKLTYAVEWFGELMHETTATMAAINQNDLIGNFNAAAKNFSVVMCQLEEAMNKLEEENTFTNLGKTVASMKTTFDSIGSISQDIAEGKGTIGKMVKGDDFYLRMTAIMSKVDTLMNDINQYGLLFSSNKHWQRLRTQRASAISALETPQEFRAYFQQEVDLINTAMERLSMVVERSETKGALQSDAFKKDFADLLREVDTMSDNLKLYNQQLMEASQDK